MEKEFRMEHSQVPLSLLVTNLTAVTTFILRSLIFIMFDYRNGRRLRSCLLFFPASVGDYYSGMLLRCGGRKMAPSTPIKKRKSYLCMLTCRGTKKEPSHIIDPFSYSPKTGVQRTFQIHIHTHSSQSAKIRKNGGGCHSFDSFLGTGTPFKKKILVTPNSKKDFPFGLAITTL